LIVRLENADGRVGWGEAAPVPAFGMERMETLEAGARAWPNFDPSAVPTLANAVASARADLERGQAILPGSEGKADSALPVAALLPAGRAGVKAAADRAEAGFRTFKWKVGVEAWRDEMVLLDDLCAALPDGSKVRLDANGAWDRRVAERWLERCADRPVEFLEQPVDWASPGADDLLAGLAADYPTPIALDESLVGLNDLERWLGNGWEGVFVIKPSLLSDPNGALTRLAAAKRSVVFSSSLETAVGARAALRHAFRWTGEPAALGFGVWPIFSERQFDGPAAAPFIRRSDVERMDIEPLWNALN
jgi:O-succinylbenzoate synthase